MWPRNLFPQYILKELNLIVHFRWIQIWSSNSILHTVIEPFLFLFALSFLCFPFFFLCFASVLLSLRSAAVHVSDTGTKTSRRRSTAVALGWLSLSSVACRTRRCARPTKSLEPRKGSGKCWLVSCQVAGILSCVHFSSKDLVSSPQAHLIFWLQPASWMIWRALTRSLIQIASLTPIQEKHRGKRPLSSHLRWDVLIGSEVMMKYCRCFHHSKNLSLF